MPMSLAQTALDPKDKSLRQMLRNLQANILKGHGRERTIHIFFSFGADVARNKAVIGRLTKMVTSAARHFSVIALMKKLKKDTGEVVGNLYLTSRGYSKLGFTPERTAQGFPEDGSTGLQIKFTTGMPAAQEELSDPPVSDWEETYRGSKIDGMMQLACDDPKELKQAAQEARAAVTSAGAILGEEEGRGLRDLEGRAIEHFGYLDGRSQPLYFKGDLEKEASRRDGGDVWDASAPLSLVLVPDPFASEPDSFGSFFVFRKLEQNIAQFRKAEAVVARELGLSGEDEARAGAMLVGRFEDGSPLVLHKSAAGHEDAENNFTFASDTEGTRCPFHAHIRKTNPRGDTVRQFGAPLNSERSHRITRRGITYGNRLTKKRKDENNLVFEALDEAAEREQKKTPTKGVGLLFMCFQANIADQFGFMQRSWANSADFVRPRTGIDPIIGQPLGSTNYAFLSAYGEHLRQGPPTIRAPFAGAVTLKGGEFFFAPSLSFLRRL